MTWRNCWVSPVRDYSTPSARSHPESVGVRHRSAFKLLTVANHKTPRGESAGWFSAILYLMPHTSGGGKTTLCPMSTPDCRAMCLASAGLSGLPKQLGAKLRRTFMFNNEREGFLDLLLADVEKLKRIAAAEGLQPALRLNGSSDVTWERIVPGWAALGLQKYDYTKIPVEHRHVDAGYHLTFSVEGLKDTARALGYLRAGQSVAVVVPEDLKHRAVRLGRSEEGFPIIDGDEADTRFLDPPGSIVLLKPKGYVRSELIRPNFFLELRRAGEIAA